MSDSGTSLSISQVDIKDSGLYQCHVRNKAGISQDTARLLVQLQGSQ